MVSKTDIAWLLTLNAACSAAWSLKGILDGVSPLVRSQHEAKLKRLGSMVEELHRELSAEYIDNRDAVFDRIDD